MYNNLHTGLVNHELSLTATPTNPVDNFQSTKDTIHIMCSLVGESLSSPEVEWAAEQVLAKLRKATPTEQDIVRAAYWWVKSQLTFIQDESILVGDLGYEDLGTGKDLLISPVILIRMIQQGESPYGDCDDYSTLLATVLIKLGIKLAWFCTIAADPREPDYFSHVYLKVGLQDGSVIALDASHGQYPGWETNKRFKVADWNIPTPNVSNPLLVPPSLPAYDPSFNPATSGQPATGIDSTPDLGTQIFNTYSTGSWVQQLLGYMGL